MSEPLPEYVDWQDLPSRATPVSAANLRRDQDATKARFAALDTTFVSATDTDGEGIPGHRARVVFDANGEVDDIILEEI